MVNELMSGPCIVLEICATEPCDDVVSAFRDMVGPADPVSKIIEFIPIY